MSSARSTPVSLYLRDESRAESPSWILTEIFLEQDFSGPVWQSENPGLRAFSTSLCPSSRGAEQGNADSEPGPAPKTCLAHRSRLSPIKDNNLPRRVLQLP